MKMQTFTMHSF